jgi:hypothetical protein
VFSPGLLDWVESKSIWGLRPEFADGFIGREPLEGLESSGEVVDPEEVGQVRFELFMGVIEVALDGGILDGSVHALHLPVGPGMVGFRQSVFDPMEATEPVEGMATETGSWPLSVLRQIGELDAVVGEHGVDAIWNCFHERVEERGGRSHVGSFHEFHDSELRCAVDGYEQVELALGGPHLGQVDVEEADLIAVELLLTRLIALDLGQTAYAMSLQAPMK